MEDTNGWLSAKVLVTGIKQVAHIICEALPVVRREFVCRVDSVVAHVKQHQIKIIREQRPERLVSRDRKSVTVRQREAGSIGVAETSQNNRGTIAKPYLDLV